MAFEFYVEAYEWKDSGYEPQFPFTPNYVAKNIDELEYKDDIGWMRLMYQVDYGEPIYPGWVYYSDEKDWDGSAGLFEYEGYDNRRYHFVLQFYKNDQETLLEAFSFDMDVRGHFGSFKSTTTQNLQQYTMVEDGRIMGEVSESLSAEFPGTVLRTGYYMGAYEPFITCPNGREYSFEGARQAGYISMGQINYLARDKPGTYNKEYFISFIVIPIVAGNYSIRFRMTYATGWLPEYSTPIRWHIQTATAWSDTITVTVYNPPKPTLEVKTVTPSELKSDDPDPLKGMPPYIVVWKDTSKTTDPLQIPQAQITFDFGDPDTGEANVASQINGTSELIFANDQTHTYSGYGSYTCRMTIIDKLGNEATATAEFKPSTQPRLIKPPTLTPTAGDQPLLVTGNAYVAGEPEPAAEWTYELLGDVSGYYEGGKTGKFVELSLLAGGNYEVACNIVDVSGVVLSTTTFAVTVNQGEVYQDTSLDMQDFDIWVFDGNGNRVDLIHPIGAQFVDTYADESYCEFRIPIDYQHANLLQPNGIIAFGYLGKAVLCIVDEYSEDELGMYITVVAKDAASVALQNRVATVSTNSTGDNGYDVQVCSGEAVLRYFAITNARSGARTIPQLRIIGENQDRGGRVVYSARYEDTLTIIRDICTDSGLGYHSTLQAENPLRFGLLIREGVDKTMTRAETENTPAVLFTDRPDSVHSARIGACNIFAYSNVAITGGEGSGDRRQYVEYGDIETTALLRKEIFVDAGDAANTNEMERMAKLELAKQKEQSVTVYPNKEIYQFGEDYEVGDTVTIQTNSGVMMDMQIRRAYYSQDETGVNITLHCGTDLRGYQKLIQESKLANTYARK